MQSIRTILARWRLRRRGNPWSTAGDGAHRWTDRLIVATVAWCGAWAGLEFVLAEPVRVFNPYSIGYVAGAALTVLAACYAAARIAGRVAAFAAFGAAVAAGMIFAIALVIVASVMLRHQDGGISSESWTALMAVGAAVLLIASYKAARSELAVRRYRALLMASIPLAGLALYGQTPRSVIWYTQRADPAHWEAHRRINVEDVYYGQYQLMRKALDTIEKQRPGTPDLYFVGFAGDASQDVFLKEVRSVGRLFDERFDTAKRSLLLVNNAATTEDVPLASGNNLWYALSEIGSIMDPEEDVLFLFLTSHGSKNVLAVNFWPLGLNNLTAGGLREILDESGIKWRVIVVSACYSGSFIEALRNDHTAVITAAAADRKSFGCGNESDFTYFGRAFFDEALRATFSFPEAFGRASESVAERERGEALTPSQPQIEIGAAIRPKLEALRDRLAKLNKDQLAGQAERRTDAGKVPAP